MLYPSINEIRKKADSRYTLVILAAQRARDLIDGKPSLLDEDLKRPVSVAAHEIAEDYLTYRRPDPAEEKKAAETLAAAEEALAAEAAEALAAEAEEATEEAEEETSELEEVAEAEEATEEAADAETDAETSAEEAADDAAGNPAEEKPAEEGEYEIDQEED